ncbi:MAG: formate dehydrogenase accessory sulfurtransferase FdhD [Thermoprotei archaeon]|nr:formate dehydrogenase accessory sulfurtransferase FdhD [Thermoprotei archaeon]
MKSLLEEFRIVELKASYYISEGLPPMPYDASFKVNVNGVFYTDITASPDHIEDSVVGLLAGNNILKSKGDLLSLNVDRESNTIEVKIAGDVALKRLFIDDCIALASQGVRVKPGFRLEKKLLNALVEDFESRGRGFQGLQATGLYSRDDKVAIIAFDVSRYVSTCKAIGRALREDLNLNSSIAIATGRATGDLVALLANVGVPIVVTSKGPVYGGFAMAALLGVTLIVYRGLREFTALTYPERLVG